MKHRHSLPAKRNMMLRFASQFVLMAAGILLAVNVLAQNGKTSDEGKMREASTPSLMICPASGCNTLRAMCRERPA
jgi:hypothetical protein